MKKKKALFILLLFAIPLLVRGQTGTIQLTVQLDYVKAVSTKVQIYSQGNDSLVYEESSEGEYTYDITRVVPVGEYYVKVYVNGKLKKIDHSIEVLTDKAVQYSIWLYNPEQIEYADTLVRSTSDIILKLMYMSERIVDDPYINTSITAGWAQGGYKFVAKNIAFGLYAGSDFRWSDFKSDTSINGFSDYDKERYFSWNFNFSYVFRMYFYDHQKWYRGPLLDLGAGYNLPLLFRHVIKDGETKTITRKIHEFSDFVVFARFGYRPMVFTIEYKLVDYIKNPFPEEPRMQIGITFIFNTD